MAAAPSPTPIPALKATVVVTRGKETIHSLFGTVRLEHDGSAKWIRIEDKNNRESAYMLLEQVHLRSTGAKKLVYSPHSNADLTVSFSFSTEDAAAIVLSSIRGEVLEQVACLDESWESLLSVDEANVAPRQAQPPRPPRPQPLLALGKRPTNGAQQFAAATALSPVRRSAVPVHAASVPSNKRPRSDDTEVAQLHKRPALSSNSVAAAAKSSSQASAPLAALSASRPQPYTSRNLPSSFSCSPAAASAYRFRVSPSPPSRTFVRSVFSGSWTERWQPHDYHARESFNGFQNQGNTCYMNAVLQSLLSLECFTTALAHPDLQALSLPSSSLYTSLLQLFWKKKRVTASRRDEPVDPSAVKTALAKKRDRFRGNSQQDAQEFMCELLDVLEEELGAFVQSAAAPQATDAGSPIVASITTTDTDHSITPACTSTATHSTIDLSCIDDDDEDDDDDSGAGTKHNRKDKAHRDGDSVGSVDSDEIEEIVRQLSPSSSVSLPARSEATSLPSKRLAPTALVSSERLPTLRIFASEIQQQIECIECKASSTVEQRFQDYSVEITSSPDGSELIRSDNIEELFWSTLKEHEIERDCEACQCKRAKAAYSFSYLPRVLVIHLKRFRVCPTSLTATKVLDKVDATPVLEVGNLCKPTTKLPAPLTSETARNSSVREANLSPPASPLHFEDSESDSQSEDAMLRRAIAESKRQSELESARAHRSEDDDEDGELAKALAASLAEEACSSGSSRGDGPTAATAATVLLFPMPPASGSINERECTSVSYRLHSVVVHQGLEASSGHYVTLVAPCNGSGTSAWSSYNDSRVTEITREDALKKASKNGYLFFYVLADA